MKTLSSNPNGTRHVPLAERTTLETLIEEYPETVAVLDWYGIDIDNHDADTNLYRLCQIEDLEVDDVLTDLRLAVAEARDDGSGEEDEEDEDEDDVLRVVGW